MNDGFMGTGTQTSEGTRDDDERCINLCASYDQNCFGPDHDDPPLEDFIPLVEEILDRPGQQYRA